MVMTVEEKQEIVKTYRRKEGDTGSSEVQVALLTHRIAYLTEHLKVHRKDFHSRRGLTALSNQRRKLLEYLKRTDLERYKKLVDQLALRY
jgi:small subunit ribosomal protein S15